MPGCFASHFPAASTSPVFGSAVHTCIVGMLERISIASSHAIVDGEHYKSETGQVLVGLVIVEIIIHIMPAEVHLSARPSMYIDDGGRFGGSIVWCKQLTIYSYAIGRFEAYLFGRDQFRKSNLPSSSLPSSTGVALGSSLQSAGSKGCCALLLRKAISLLPEVKQGPVSMPSPLVSHCILPPVTDTVPICLRSLSPGVLPVLAQKEICFPSLL